MSKSKAKKGRTKPRKIRKTHQRQEGLKHLLLDVHSDYSALVACDEFGEIFLQTQVPTTREGLRGVVETIPGPKRVVFENGPMSALVNDALKDLVDEIVSADPTRNALIARSEDSCDELDAYRLGMLDRAHGIHPVYVPDEPHRSLRSTLQHDHGMADAGTAAKNRIKAVLRRHAIPCRGQRPYQKQNRTEIARQLPNAHWRWQLRSLWRQLDSLRAERVAALRQIRQICKKLPVVKRLREIPGVGALVAPTIVAWIVDPRRFSSRGELSAYGGLGLGQNITGWKVVGRARASRRGQRELKRVLFIAARSATKGKNSLADRYRARIAAGWQDRKAIRDIARQILFIACAMMRTGKG
jgi:transposase